MLDLPHSSDDRPRLVIDAVGFVRSLINPKSAWGAIVFDYAPRYTLVISDEVGAEIRDVLERPEITRKFDLLSEELRDVLSAILIEADRVELDEIPVVCRDPNDDKILATAVAGAADFIATEDKDLLDMSEYEGIRIVTGLELLKILREG